MSTTTPTRQHLSTGSHRVPRPAEGHWPGLATPPHHPVRARIARKLFLRAVDGLDVRVELPDGTQHGAGGPDSPSMQLVRPDDFFQRLGADGLIGFGEAWMVGDWDSDGLPAVL
ncbi:MAG: SAM-dependent methyltransferase, partial [Mycobacteriaceae bacterium]